MLRCFSSCRNFSSPARTFGIMEYRLLSVCQNNALREGASKEAVVKKVTSVLRHVKQRVQQRSFVLSRFGESPSISGLRTYPFVKEIILWTVKTRSGFRGRMGQLTTSTR